jgi:Histidine kinase-, DNA gyrase B-, and HSP90-like ATPase
MVSLFFRSHDDFTFEKDRLVQMQIELSNAISTFHPNPSYEQVYFEAIANALDAGASEISIQIKIDAYDSSETLELIIQDDGEGFTDKNFDKFSRLLKVESSDHKGLGRLIYLAYFEEIFVESTYGEQKRTFCFDSEFDGNSDMGSAKLKTGTIFHFKKYRKSKLYSYEYLVPEKIKRRLIDNFFPVLFQRRQGNSPIAIDISLDVTTPNSKYDFVSSSVLLTLDDLPTFKEAIFSDNNVELFSTFKIYYSIEKDITKERSLSTAVSIDGRAIEYDLIPLEAIPHAHQARFLFVSDFFKGKTNASRQKFELPDEMTERNLKKALRRELQHIINQEIPEVQSNNQKIRRELDSRFPHLNGYFSEDYAGLIIKNAALEDAQKRFFNDQKRILDCEHLDTTRYEKALELSSRALAEYVMYRTRIISRLKEMTSENHEKELHNLIVPMQKTLKQEDFGIDVYNNNIWMLDDRFMSYNTVLSDELMEKVVKEITADEIEDNSRPDITIVFSGDPQASEHAKFSVVVVELKKHGVNLAKKEEVVSQLRQRARRLLKYFPDKIDRIWFYGITDIDSDFRISLLEDGFKQLFSIGQMFFSVKDIIVDDENNPFKIDLFIMTYDTLINDAESRNTSFLEILKHQIRAHSMPETSPS